MGERLYDYIEITDLKDMLNKTDKLYENNIAYQIKIEENKYIEYTHKEVRQMINSLGTKLINMGLKGKRISVIGENRYEWEIAYLSIVCGTGVVVPLDKSLPVNELSKLIEESEVEAIFCSGKYVENLKEIKNSNIGKLKYIISMDLKETEDGIYSENQLIKEGEELVKNGDTSFIDAKINPKEMSIMLFTSGTTSKPKVVALSHENICTNLMDIGSILDVNSNDVLLSFLPLHHVFECTVGFLFSLYKGSKTVFCDGIRHMVENLNEYNVTVMCCVPAMYERILNIIIKNLDRLGTLDEVTEKMQIYKNSSMEEKKKVFEQIHNMLGGKIKLFISGAAGLDKEVEEKYRLVGINIVQGYGLTETSPVVAVGTNKYYRLGSIGKALPSVEVKIDNPNSEGIGELLVKAKSVMLGYFQNEEANAEAFDGDWFRTGDFAKIDEEGYIFILGRKKNMILLKNGKKVFPEEIEVLINKLEEVDECFIFGMPSDTDVNDSKVSVKIVYNEKLVQQKYGNISEDEVFKIIWEKIKDINKLLPTYKYIKQMILSNVPLIKTTTGKIRRNEELKLIMNK